MSESGDICGPELSESDDICGPKWRFKSLGNFRPSPWIQPPSPRSSLAVLLKASVEVHRPRHAVVAFFLPISDKLNAYQINYLNKVQQKTCLKYHTITYYSRLMRLLQYLRRLCINKLKKSKSVIPSRSMYLARHLYKLRLNSWYIKYSQNVQCVCKNILSVNTYYLNVLLPQLFQKNG